MIHHKGKIQGCIENARAVRAVVAEYGSFKEYVESFSPRSSLDNLMRLRKDLKTRFAYLGSITSYHFLTDIGMPVLKPDRVIRRIFSRLGLVEDASETEQRLSDVVRKGNEFAQATGHPIRYIDIVFVAYGQVKGEVGLAQGICLEKQPRCSICGATGYCQYLLSPTAGKA
jgi:DNA-3-methyladenine glycosylase I